MDMIIEFLMYFLLQYPGAFIRWIFNGFKKPWKKVLNEDPLINAGIGMLFFVGVLLFFLL